MGSIRLAPEEIGGHAEGAINRDTTAKIDVRATNPFSTTLNSSDFDFYLHNAVNASNTLTKVANLTNTASLKLYTPIPTSVLADDSAGVYFNRTGSDNNAQVGYVKFSGETDTGATSLYGQIKTNILDSSNSDPKGIMRFLVDGHTSNGHVLTLEPDQATIDGNLKITNPDTSITAHQSIGKIEWQAPNEASGGKADDVTAK